MFSAAHFYLRKSELPANVGEWHNHNHLQTNQPMIPFHLIEGLLQGVIPRAPRRQEDLLPAFEQGQLQHVNEQQDARHHREHQRLVHELERRQDHDDREHDRKQHEHRARRQARVGRARLVAPHGGPLVRFDALGEDEEHHRPHEDAHDDEEEDVGAAPLVDAEGVEGLAVGVAVHAVLVDAAAHVPGGEVVAVVVTVLVGLVLKLAADEGHLPLEVGLVVLLRLPPGHGAARVDALQPPQSPPHVVVEVVKIVVVRLVVVVHGVVVVDVVAVVAAVVRRRRVVVVVGVVVCGGVIVGGVVVRVVVLLVVARVVGLGDVGVVVGIVVPSVLALLDVLASLVVVVLLLLALVADVVVVVPGRVTLGEGVGDFLGGAALAAVEGRAEGHLVAQEVPVDVVAVAGLPLVVAVHLGALLVAVEDELQLGGGVRVAVLTPDLGVEGIIAVGRLLEHDAVQEAHVPRQFEVVPVRQRLVVKVGPHVVGDADHEGPEVLEVAVEGGRLLEELEFDHVAVVVVDAADGHDGHLAEVHVVHVQVSVVPRLPLGHGLVHGVVVVHLRPVVGLVQLSRNRRQGIAAAAAAGGLRVFGRHPLRHGGVGEGEAAAGGATARPGELAAEKAGRQGEEGEGGGRRASAADSRPRAGGSQHRQRRGRCRHDSFKIITRWRETERIFCLDDCRS
mmetsp:Transcript_40852/g.87007  ORF Transcript_40852/g.87007 Transcript_40852/m.87007 type:complete len:677 (+) Transcript_40852:181-2211(+)